LEYKIKVISLGCDKNLVDSENMMGILKKDSFTFTPNIVDADIVIINTCGFIESAKEESIEKIFEVVSQRKKGQVIIVAGCLAQRYYKELMEEIPEIDGVVGTGSFHKITKAINQCIEGEKTLLVDTPDKYEFYDLPRIYTTSKPTAYIKIAEGCSNRCSYCIIPELRGSYRSRPKEFVLKEIAALRQKGIKEAILVAQDTTSYGYDLYNNYRLKDLLLDICNTTDIEWVRLLYCYPTRIEEDLLKVIAANKQICNYLDIPLQHCSDKILKKMGRPFDKSYINLLIDNIRCEIPEISIRSTFIVGFPGETDIDFEELLCFLEEKKIDKVGFFMYSEEEGTPASRIPNKVPEEVKRKRFSKVYELQMDISLKINQKLKNRILKVLIEGYDEEKRMYYGRSYREAPDVDGLIYVKGKQLKLHEFYNVQIKQCYEYDLTGEVL